MGATRPMQLGAFALVGRWLGAGLVGSYLVAGVIVAWDELKYPDWEWGAAFITLLTGTIFAVYAVPGAFVLALLHLLIRPVQRVPLDPQGPTG